MKPDVPAAPPLSRREFLRLALLGLAGTFLAACGLGNAPIGRSLSPSPAPAAGSGPAGSSPTLGPEPATATPLSSGNPAAASGPAPILGRPTDRSVAANFLPAGDGQIWYEYGTAPAAYGSRTTAQAVSAGAPVETEIADLAPATRYWYRLVESGSPGPEHSFVTQRPPGGSFVFTIDADPHNGDPNTSPALYAVAMANALADQPDFHVNLGDTFMTEKLGSPSPAQVVDTYTSIRPKLGILAADAPLFLVNGNHEGELGWFLDGGASNLAVRCAQTRRAHYPCPQPGGFYSGGSTPEPFIGLRDGYYAWTWGDALFVALDPFWYTLEKPGKQSNGGWGYTLGKAQYDWLKQTLEASPAKYKFVFIHNLVGGRDKDARGGIEAAPYYEWGGKNADGSDGFDTQRPGWGTPIHQLLVENHVSASFHGHDHVFVHQELDGIVYQEFPQPSLTKYDNTGLAQQYGYTHGDVVSSSGHLRVTVNPDQAKVEYVRAYRPQDETSGRKNGQVDYTYAVSA